MLNLSSTASVRQHIFGGARHQNNNNNNNVEEGQRGESGRAKAQFCECLSQLGESFCSAAQPQQEGPQWQQFSTKSAAGQHSSSSSSMDFHSEVGRMLYTISILLMFSLVILLLMIRSIRRSHSSAELETLLDAMRFREELEIQQRQKHRLRKAKRKVTAWLCRGQGAAKLWQSSPHIVLPKINTVRTNSLQSCGSYIPEIVISTEHTQYPDSAPNGRLSTPETLMRERQHSCTPSLSLIYDFSYDSRKGSRVSLEEAEGMEQTPKNSRRHSEKEEQEADDIELVGLMEMADQRNWRAQTK